MCLNEGLHFINANEATATERCVGGNKPLVHGAPEGVLLDTQRHGGLGNRCVGASRVVWPIFEILRVQCSISKVAWRNERNGLLAAHTSPVQAKPATKKRVCNLGGLASGPIVSC